MKIKFQATGRVATEALSRRLYSDPKKAAAELVYNGLDAAHRARRSPSVAIRIFAAGSHPLSSGPALVVADNGTGFTSEVVAAYCQVAESSRTGHGRHGIGKFAAFALCGDADPSYFIASATGKSGKADLLEINGEVFRAEGFESRSVERSSIPGFPTFGSGSQVVIPNWKGGFTVQELSEFLSQNLPHTEWEVTIDGVQVPRRTVEITERVEVPSIPGLHGQVFIELGKAPDASHPDSVWLMDRKTSRPVVQIAELPREIRRKIVPSLTDPQLVGYIWVPDLEDHSSGDRQGLSSDFWVSQMGAKLIAILNTYAAPAAKRVLGDDEKPGDMLSNQLRQVGDSFSRVFGDPEAPMEESSDPDEDEDGDGDDPPLPPGDPKPRPPKPPRTPRPKPPVLKPGDMSRGTYVRVEGSTYQVLPLSMKGNVVPSEVRMGNVLVVNTEHPDMVRYMSKKGGGLRELLRRIIIEAHVSYEYGSGEIRRTYELEALVQGV